MASFQIVWRRIQTHAGEEFTQIRGSKFTYEVTGGHVVPNRTNQQIPESHFERAFVLVPMENTVPIQHLRGPSYIYAILMDDRIRMGDW